MCNMKERKDSVESNNNESQQPSFSSSIVHPRHKRNRMKKRMSTLLHTHVALIILTTCSVLDAVCVIGQIIADILIMKDELHEKEILEMKSKEIIFETFPDILNQTIHGAWSLPSMLKEIQKEHGHHDDGHSHNTLDTLASLAKLPWEGLGDFGMGMLNDTLFGGGHAHDSHTHGPGDMHSHSHARFRRGAGGNHKHDLLSESAMIHHYMLHELTHAFHLGSLVILTFLVLVTYFKIFIMGKKFLHHKIEVFDAFVITVSWALDIAMWEGLWANPEEEAARIISFILPWRVIRIVNSFVLVIQGRDLLQLKIVKQQYRGSVKRASELKMKLELYRVEMKNLQSLCKRKGASEKELQQCAASQGRRRRSSLLPVLNRLASLGLSVNSTTDLSKSSFEPPTPHDSDDDEDTTYIPAISRMSSVSLDDYSVGRTLSNSTCSTLPVSPRVSVNSISGEDNPVFEDVICQNPNGGFDGQDTKL